MFYLWDAGIRPTHDSQFQTTFHWDVDLLSGYEHEFVPNVAASPGTHRFGGLHNPQLSRRLASWKPSVILLFGYKSRAQLGVIKWAKLRRVPLIFRGDSHLLGRTRGAFASRLALRILYAQFAAITYVGAANRDYFSALGVPAEKLFFAPHAVDADLFHPDRKETLAAAAALRVQLRLAAATRVVLFAGKLVAAKQPRELLQAFLSLRFDHAALVFVGDGEEQAALLDLARNAPPGTVHILPFANQSAMPAYYAMADIFVLPSRGVYETWGLAVNEAMRMGRPCLVSDRVGCQRDLVTDGETGWVFHADDPAHLREKLTAALNADLSTYQLGVRTRIARYSYEQTTTGLLAAITAVARMQAGKM